MNKIKFPWGKLFIVGVTKKFSIGIDVVHPKKETDKKGTYLKVGKGTYYVLEGNGLCGEKPIKKGEILDIRKGQKINLINNSSNNLVVMTIYTPPYNENNIGYKI